MLSELLIARTAIAPGQPDYSHIGAIYRLISRLRNRGLERILSGTMRLVPGAGRVTPRQVMDTEGVHWVH